MPDILAITQQFAWWGKAAGYSTVVDHFPAHGAYKAISIPSSGNSLSNIQRLFTRKRYREMRTSSALERTAPLLEQSIRKKLRQNPNAAVHYLHIEKSYGTGSRKALRLKMPLIGTVHQPRSWWTLNHLNPEILRDFDGVIALSRELRAHIDELGVKRSKFIPHGVNTDHFCPSSGVKEANDCPRILCVGHWLRDFPLLERIVMLTRKRSLNWHFDVILPRWKCEEPEMIRLARHPNVEIRYGLSDAALVEAYQMADISLIPLIDCVGNNALVEAVACGLPIVVSDLPAVSDYVTEEFAVKVLGDEAGDYVDVLENQLSSQWSQSARLAAREYALKNLAWPIVAQQTVEFYQQIAY